MKETTLFLLFLLLPLAAAQPLHYYELDLGYDNGTISYHNFKVIASNEEIVNSRGDFILDLISFKNKTLNTTYFTFPLVIDYDYFDNNGTITERGTKYLNKTTTTVYVPYHPEARDIEVYDYNFTKKLAIKVGDYSKEIPKQVKKEEQKKVEKKRLTEVEEKIKKIPTWKFIAGIGGLFVLIIIVAIILGKVRRKNE